MNPEEEQIGKLKVQGINTADEKILLNIIDSLGKIGKGEYRTQAMDAILFIINTKANENVRPYGLDIVKKIKEGSI